MFLFLTVVGAAGAGLLFAVNPWPALGARTKNTAGLVVAALIGAALWQSGIAFAWNFPAAWFAASLLMWACQFEVDPEDMVWLRVLTSTGLVVLLTQLFR